MTERRYALTADLGGTRTRAALVDSDGSIARRYATDTLARQGRDAVMERLADALDRVSDGTPRASLAGVGLSVASPTHPVTGEMHSPPNLPGDEWHLYSPNPFLERRFGLPARAANDATLGALGEHTFGAGRGTRNMIYMTVSTGIGGGVIINGELYGGASGFAGEIGHMTIDRNGPIDNCGNIGCLEALASGTAMARMARERLASGEASALRDMCGGDADAIDARMVAAAAADGDAMALALMREIGENLGAGIVSLMHIFDPDLIVIGGGVSQNLDLLMPGIDAQISSRAMAHFRGSARIARSELGDDVSLLGAAALALGVGAAGEG